MSYSVSEAFQRIEEEMITSMSRNLKRHIDWEQKEGFEWTAWQAEQLAALKEYREQNREVFEGYFSTINDKIGEVIQKAYESGNQDQEIKILEALKAGFELPASKAAGNFQGSFFKINQRKIDALIKATKGEMRAAETAMLRMNDDSYRKTIFDAVTYYNTGAGTLPQCVDMATKDFLSRGINCIEYSNGARVGIDVYARMALRTAETRAYVQGEATKRDEWGVNTVIVNKRGVACPKCLRYVGKVFYDDVWGNIEVTDNKYPKLSDAISGGLYHPNCKDIHTTYFEGISSPPEKMTKAQVDEANRVYKLEQLQRGYERNIRKYKRLAAGSIDPENKKLYEAKLKEWQKAQAEFIAKNSDVLKRRYELEKIFPERNTNRITLIQNREYSDTNIDFTIGKSLGAKAKNYEVVDKATNIVYNIIEGSTVQNATVFAGYHGKKPLNEETVHGLVKEFGGSPEKWQHAKGFAVLNVDGEEVKAEVHWFQEESIGKVKFKVKEWLYDES